jgi:hypothetical protein
MHVSHQQFFNRQFRTQKHITFYSFLSYCSFIYHLYTFKNRTHNKKDLIAICVNGTAKQKQKEKFPILNFEKIAKKLLFMPCLTVHECLLSKINVCSACVQIPTIYLLIRFFDNIDKFLNIVFGICLLCCIYKFLSNGIEFFMFRLQQEQ